MTERPSLLATASRRLSSSISSDKNEFSEKHDDHAPPIGLDMAGHDTFLLGPKVVLLDSFIVDLLNVDTSAQTFKLKLLLNMDWEDDGTIGPEVKNKRGLGRRKGSLNGLYNTDLRDTYKTGKYVLLPEFCDDPLSTTWNPEVVLVNAIADENPIDAGSKFHAVQMLSGRPLISRSVLYQPECRCEFTFSNFPFDVVDLVVKFSSNKWDSEQVVFKWSERLRSMSKYDVGKSTSFLASDSFSIQRETSFLKQSVDSSAIGGIGLSEFEIIKVRVSSTEVDVNSMQRYDNSEGAFSQAHLIIRVRRDPYSYLLRVASVAELLMVLEVLSFITDSGDLSARFSVSGTIFLAMVSLYGESGESLPKVSVVTRVDKWHLFNFFLLFASNVENLIAYIFRDIVGERIMHHIEVLLGILYLYFVMHNLFWFIAPLAEREEYSLLLTYFEHKAETYFERFCQGVDFCTLGLLTKAKKGIVSYSENKASKKCGIVETNDTKRKPSLKGKTESKYS